MELEPEEKEEMKLSKELESLPARLAVIAGRERSRARESFGIQKAFDPRAQFDRGFIPALHAIGDPLPDKPPTSTLQERVGVPAFR